MKKMLLCFVCTLLLPLASSRTPRDRNVDFNRPTIAPEVLGDGSLPLCTPIEPCGPHFYIAEGSLSARPLWHR